MYTHTHTHKHIYIYIYIYLYIYIYMYSLCSLFKYDYTNCMWNGEQPQGRRVIKSRRGPPGGGGVVDEGEDMVLMKGRQGE